MLLPVTGAEYVLHILNVPEDKGMIFSVTS